MFQTKTIVFFHLKIGEKHGFLNLKKSSKIEKSTIIFEFGFLKKAANKTNLKNDLSQFYRQKMGITIRAI